MGGELSKNHMDRRGVISAERRHMKKTCISKGWILHAPHYHGSVDLPNDYSVTAPRDPHAEGGGDNGYFVGGTGRYHKDLTVDALPNHSILDIDGAYMCATVYCNGYAMVTHPHGYAPILVDLTPHIKSGENNTLDIVTRGLQPSTRWYSGAGVYRDVFLWQGGDIRIEPWDTFVSTPTTDSVKASYEISADRDAEVTVSVMVCDGNDTVARDAKSIRVTAKGKTKVEFELSLPDAHLWDTEDPYLYTLRATVTENGMEKDTDETTFGVRVFEIDAENGLRLNGRPMKLRGGCIHHDHGLLGAADYPAACRRKLTLLKKAGFNAVRIAHNPPSLNLLTVCDEIGMIVMDEAFDCWRREKGGVLNYHVWFDDWWERDIAAMVLRDRNHPCVLSYSIGNEIFESDGLTDGDIWAARLADEIRKYDATRPVTAAVFPNIDQNVWGERTEGFLAPLDLCGYNYLFFRYAKDHETYPKRVIWGSETQALNFYKSWKATLENDHVIGDFTWTAYDNLGEAGMGKYLWERDGRVEGIGIAAYPWRACYQGDLDLCGYRRPQSYFRETVWIGGTEPRIFTTHPEHYGEGFTGTGWHWRDVQDSWTFDDAYIGKPVPCEVYTDADEIVWYLNGREIGRSTPAEAVARLEIPYEKGELAVTAYKNGEICGSSFLHTVGKPAQVLVEAESASIRADARDLCYFDITIADANGHRVPDQKSLLRASGEGGRLVGIFSGDPANDDQYGSDTCHAYEGRAVAVVMADQPGIVRLTVVSPGLADGTHTVSAEAYTDIG